MAKQPEQPRQQPSADERISLAFLEVSKTPAGKIVIDYLRASYVNTAMSPDATDAQLRYREGQRSVVGVWDQRVREGVIYARKPA